jgi:hypothetical protein
MLKKQEDNIISICKDEGHSFVSWIYGNNSKYSKFEWLCDKGHSNKTIAKGFLKLGYRCETCNFGYFRRNSNSLDNLYLIRLDNNKECFIKIGRTFDILKRIDEFKEVGYIATVLSSVKAKHETIYKLEKKYHEVLNEYQYTPKMKFVGWTECYHKKVLTELIVVSVNNFYLNQLNKF